MSRKSRQKEPEQPSSERYLVQSIPAHPRLIQIVLLLVIGGYLVWFFSKPGSFAETRLSDLFGLLLPDDLLYGTLGRGSEHLEVGVIDRFPVLLAALAWLAIGFWIGKPIVMPLRCIVTRLEAVAFSTLAGLSLLSTVTVLMGVAGFLRDRWLAVPVAVLILTSYFLQRRTTRSIGQPRRKNSFFGSLRPSEFNAVNAVNAVNDFNDFNKTTEVQPTSQTERWLWRMSQVSVLLLGLLYIFSGLMPPYEFDVVEYHLQGPKEFFQSGQIGFVPHNVYLNMPLGTEMHSLAFMSLIDGEDAWWFGGLAGKLITASFSLLAVMLAVGFTGRHFGSVAAWATAAMLLSAPGNLHVAGCGLVDSVLGAYTLATVIATHCLLVTLKQSESAIPTENQGTNEKRTDSHPLQSSVPLTSIKSSAVTGSALWASIALFSLTAGTSVACKYTGFVFVWIPVASLTLLMVRRNKVLRSGIGFMRMAVILMIGLVITAGPWLAKNAAHSGNPVFPLANQFLGSYSENWTAQQAERWNRAHRAPEGPSLGSNAKASSPHGISALLSGLQQVVVNSPYLPPTLVPLAAIGLFLGFSRKRNTVDDASSNATLTGFPWLDNRLQQPLAIPAILLIWIIAVWWLATHRIDRFWLPALPLMAVLSGAGYHFVFRRLGLSVAAGLLLLSSVYGIYLGMTGSLCDQRWFVSLESLRIDKGTEDYPGRVPKTTVWINRNLARDGTLLLIGEARVFDFEPHVQYATCFNTPPGETGLSGKSANEQLHWLREHNVRHLLVHWNEIERYRSPGNYGFSSWPSRADIEQMVSGGVLQEAQDWPFNPNEVSLLSVASGEVSLTDEQP